MTTTATIRELLVVLDDHEKLIAGSLEHPGRLLAAGGLARARALLEGMCVLIEGDRADATGPLSRAILEVCVTSLYVLLSEEEEDERGSANNPALGAFLRDYAKHVRKISKAHENPRLAEYADQLRESAALEGGKPGLASLKDRCAEVARLIAPFAPAEAFDWEKLYDNVYIPESTLGAHPSVGVFDRYLDRDDDGTFRIRHRREQLIPVQAHMGAGMTLALAQHVYRVFGVEMDHSKFAPVSQKLIKESEPLSGPEFG